MIRIPEYGICYAPIPKNACTTLKRAMFWIQNDRHFENYQINGKYFSIHNFHQSFGSKPDQPKLSEYVDYEFRFCVLRNPIDRLVSCFRNRVLYHKELKNTEYEHLEKSFDGFVEALAEVCANVPSIDHHTLPQWNYVGEIESFYTHIYRFSDLAKLEKNLSEIVGRRVEFEKTQTSDKRVEINPNGATLQKIKDFYEKDYMLFGQYF